MRGIHHVGVAVVDLDEAIATYETLFHARLEHREPIADQGVEAASMLVGAYWSAASALSAPNSLKSESTMVSIASIGSARARS